MQTMNSTLLSFIKNKNLLEYNSNIAHAFVTYRIDSSKYDYSIIEEIAIGQSLGAWDTSYVAEDILKKKVAKLVNCEQYENYFEATIAFPYNLWLGNLSWLITLMFGKMSFYPGIQLNSVEFSKNCNLNGPKNSINDLRKPFIHFLI